MVVFKRYTRTIGIKFNGIHLAIVKGGYHIAHPALFVITESRKGLFDILFHCCEICAGVAPAGYLFTCFTKVVQTILDIVGGIFKVINCALHFVATFAILD